LRQFMTALVIFITAVALLAVLDYHQLTDIEALAPLRERNTTGAEEDVVFVRLRGVGLFNDPNDMSLMLVMAMLLAIRGALESRRGAAKGLYLGTVVLLGYALSLTQSRGGFLAMVSAVLVLAGARLGWRRTAWLSLVAVPFLLVLFGGRQTQISADTDTGQ